MQLRPIRRARYLYDLLHELVVRDLKLRYKRSLLGIGWSLLNPLLQIAVFYLVFTTILPVPVKDYALFLFTGILSWSWFQSSVQAGCAAITDNVPLVRQPNFPAVVLPVAVVASNFLNFVFAVPVVLAFSLIQGHRLDSVLLLLPVIAAVQFLFTLSVVYLLATVHVPFRDTQYLTGILLLLGFYISPVLYPSSSVPSFWSPYFRLNPMAPILEAYRDVFVRGDMPNLSSLAAVALLSCLILGVSYSLFQRTSHWFVEEIGG